MSVIWERGPSVLMATVGVLAPVALVQLFGRLEPAMFLVSLLAVVVARWEDSPWRAGVGCTAAAASPVVIVALQPADTHITWAIRVIGIAFPAVIGRGVSRQQRLAGELMRERAATVGGELQAGPMPRGGG